MTQRAPRRRLEDELKHSSAIHNIFENPVEVDLGALAARLAPGDLYGGADR